MSTTEQYDPGLSRRFMAEADTALAAGDAAGALEALRTAWSHDPYNEELPLLCATLQLQAGDAIRAAHLAIDALKVRPYYPSALDVLGVACVEALQPELALSILGKAVAMAPELENPKVNLEAARQSKRDLAKADVPKNEILKSAQLLPQKAIRAILAGERPRLTASIVLTDGQGPSVKALVESLEGIASEIILVDSRHTKSDPDVKGLPGVTLVEMLHAHDVAAARSESVRRATGDWILVLDADETFEADPTELGRALADPLALAHMVRSENAAGGGCRRPRLVRNVPGLRFLPGIERRCTRSLTRLEQQWGLTIRCESEFVVRSAGDPAPEAEVATTALEEIIAQDPDNIDAQAARARVELDAGRTQNALDMLREVLERLDAAGRDRALEVEEVVLLTGCCLMRLERYDELRQLTTRYEASLPISAGSQFLRGAAAKAAGDFEKAAKLLLEALELRGHATFAPPITEVRGPALPTLLGAAMLDIGDLKQAAESFDVALTLDPDNVEAALGKVALHMAEGAVRTVLEDLDRLVAKNGANPTVWITGGVVLGHMPELGDTAVEWLAEAQRRFPWHVEIRQRLGEAQLRNGDAETALETWAPLGEAGTEPGARVVASLVSGKQLPELDEASGEQVRGQVLGWFHRFMVAGSYEVLDRALVNLDRADEVIPELKSRTAIWLESLGQHDAANNLRKPEPTV